MAALALPSLPPCKPLIFQLDRRGLFGNFRPPPSTLKEDEGRRCAQPYKVVRQPQKREAVHRICSWHALDACLDSGPNFARGRRQPAFRLDYGEYLQEDQPRCRKSPSNTSESLSLRVTLLFHKALEGLRVKSAGLQEAHLLSSTTLQHPSPRLQILL